MAVLFWSCVAVAVSFLLHLAVWRIRVPRRQTRAVLLCFFGVGAAVLAALAVFPPPSAAWPWPGGLAQFVQIALFILAFTLAYTTTYSAVEVDSPSLIMVMAVEAAGEKGVSAEEFHARLTDRVLIDLRVADADRDGLLRKEGDKLLLTSKGRSFVRLFIFFRAILGAGKGG